MKKREKVQKTRILSIPLHLLHLEFGYHGNNGEKVDPYKGVDEYPPA